MERFLPKFVHAGYAAQIRDLLHAPIVDLLNELTRKLTSAPMQVESWRNTIQTLQGIFSALSANSNYLDWGIVLEYNLPMEIGRRPDLILINQHCVYVIEIKNMTKATNIAVEQTKAYTRDIREYHRASADYRVQGILLILRTETEGECKPIALKKDDILICSPTPFQSILKKQPEQGISQESLTKWLTSPYEPLPSLVKAAKMIFENQHLPHIKRVENAGIPETLKTLHHIVNQAREIGGYHLILIGGVPGSGKTLVGLQFAHEFASENELAFYLSGNAPLVATLQDYLGATGKTFVRDVAAFVENYYVRDRKSSKTRVLIFDEAQRAWDAPQVGKYLNKKKKRNADLDLTQEKFKKSEPEIFTIIVSQMQDWGVCIGLIGDGQEIHVGEEAGIQEWRKALEHTSVQWTVHTPERFAHIFSIPKNWAQIVDPTLDLTHTLRTHAAQNLHTFVNQLLEANFHNINNLANELKQVGYFLYLTEDLDIARKFLEEFYDYNPDKTYGLIASSLALNLIDYRINVKDHTDPNCFCTRFYGANDVPMYYNFHEKSKRQNLYCRAFRKVVREFDCQGLELDSAILAWGTDFTWAALQSKWKFDFKKQRTKNPNQIRVNAYRVLLTRARDGLILYCPGDELKETRGLLFSIGFESLERHQLEDISIFEELVEYD